MGKPFVLAIYLPQTGSLNVSSEERQQEVAGAAHVRYREPKNLQWSVHSEETFCIDLLESEYVQGAHADFELS